MVKTRKTGKSLNIKLTDTIKLLKFLRGFLSWDVADGYLNHLGEKLVPLSSIRSNTITIYPKYILVPTTRYSLSFINLEANLKGVEITRKHDIETNKPVQFDEYEIIDYFWGPRSKVEISFYISFYEEKKTIEVYGASIKVKSNVELNTYYYPLYFDVSEGMRHVVEGVEAFAKSNGKKFEDVELESPAAALRIGVLEDTMFLSLNVFYSIYSGIAKEDTVEYKIFEPFTRILNSYGKDFEEVLSVIKDFSVVF